MEKINIFIKNPVESFVDISQSKAIAPAISFKKEYWRKGQFQKRKTTYNKTLWLYKEKGMVYFYTGNIRRIMKRTKKKIKIYGMENLGITPAGDYTLPNIVFRPGQESLVQNAVKAGRGIIKAPTGSGKTIVIASILKAYNKKPSLVLAHTNDLVRQAASELKKFGFKSVGVVGGGEKDLTKKITVSTVQTFKNLDLKKLRRKYGCVIVDEAHHAKSPSYISILTTLLAPNRFGVTATLPTSQESILTIEGLIGPVIAELKLDKAADLQILVKPKIKFLRYNPPRNLRSIKNYRSAYDYGIINNRPRNVKIRDFVWKMEKEGKSCLVMVVNKEHGRILSSMLNAPFVQGETEIEERLNLKSDLDKKQIRTLISSVVFREGVNIQSLDCIILAGGGKGELPLLQSIGRGLRTCKGKETCIVVDFLDLENKHLLFHLGNRIGVYSDLGWL